MHPTLMTLIADDRALEMRSAADARRRSRLARPRARRRLKIHLPRRATQVAHV